MRARRLLVALFALAGCTDGGDSNAPAGDAPDEVPTADTAGEEIAEPDGPDGAALYGVYCAFCHGEQGQGYVSDQANALANPTFLATASDEFLRLGTIHGRPGTPMSAWGRVKGGPLDDQQVDAIVAHVRSWQTADSIALSDEPVEGSALRGRGPYNVHCAECHGEDGAGGEYMSIGNPWFLETASDAYIRHAIVEGRPGTAMEGFGDTLPDRTIDDLVALVRSWAVPVDGEPIAGFEPDFEDAVLDPDGADPTWELREGRYVGIDAVNAAMEAGEAFVLLDARPVADFATSHITGATSLPFYEVENHLEALPRDRWIVTYCGCPHAVSGQAADALLAAGFERVAVLDEGCYEWEDRGYPVTVPEGDATAE